MISPQIQARVLTQSWVFSSPKHCICVLLLQQWLWQSRERCLEDDVTSVLGMWLQGQQKGWWAGASVPVEKSLQLSLQAVFLCFAATAQDSIMRELAYIRAPKPLPWLTVSVARWRCRHSGTLESLGGSRYARPQRVSTCSLHQHPQPRLRPVCGNLKSSIELPS